MLKKFCTLFLVGVLVLSNLGFREGGYRDLETADLVTVDTSNFSGNLNSQDDTVQKALDTLDALTTGGLTSLNGLTGATQTFSTGTSGTDFGISSSGTAHSFNLPTASGSNRGALSSTDWTTFNSKFTLPSLTSGSALFSNGTTIAQDNQGYLYNDTENRLSVFTTLGNEVLTNGTFTGSATGWTVPSGMAYSANAVSKTSNGTGALTQNISVYVLREYLLTYTISGWTVGTVTPSFGGVTGTAVGANGTYTERFVVSSSAALTFTPTNTARFTIDSISLKPLTGNNQKSNINTGGLSIEGSWSNGSPNTTRAMTFNNDGSYTWTDYRFAGVLRGAIGANSSGGIDMYASGGNYFGFYYGNSGLTSNSLFAYLYPTAFIHNSGYGAFASGVMAGSQSANTSTLQSAGGLALKTKSLTASGTLDNTATHWLLDATDASACAGTPAVTACSTYSASGQVTCESHLPCSYNAGTSCTVYNGDISGCSGAGSPCAPDTSSCAGPTSDPDCSNQNSAYGGTCTLNYTSSTCSSFTNTTDCNAASPCYATLGGDCNTLSDGGGDGTSCATQPECSYDSGTGVCSLTFFTSCDGDNSFYSCDGTYNNGNCGGGSFGVSCNGTVSCASYSSSGACVAETDCLWSSVLNGQLVDGLSYPDRTLFVSNDASNGSDSIIYPATTSPATTINGASSYTLANYQDGVHLNFYQKTKPCSTYVTEGTCTPTGCTPVPANCSYDTMTGDCTGDAVCTAHNGDQTTCEATTYFSYCSGIEIISRDWRVYADVKKASSTGWAMSNVTSDKVLDANSTTLSELADVVGTLVNALKDRGDIAS